MPILTAEAEGEEEEEERGLTLPRRRPGDLTQVGTGSLPRPRHPRLPSVQESMLDQEQKPPLPPKPVSPPQPFPQFLLAGSGQPCNRLTEPPAASTNPSPHDPAWYVTVTLTTSPIMFASILSPLYEISFAH